MMMITLFFNLVGTIFKMYNRRLQPFRFLQWQDGIAHDDDHITLLYLAGGSSVQAYRPRPALAPDDIGLETLAVIVVDHSHLLMYEHLGRIDQIFINRNASFIVKIGVGNRR